MGIAYSTKSVPIRELKEIADNLKIDKYSILFEGSVQAI